MKKLKKGPQSSDERARKVTPILTFSSSDKKDILLKRFEESSKELTIIQNYNWKGITIVTTAVSALLGLGSTELLKIEFRLYIAAIALLFILIGIGMLIRDREPFLEHVMIISRIERLLGLHEQESQFRDNRLLPVHFEEVANCTYDEYIRGNKWKLKSLFFAFFSFYIFLAFIVVFWGFYPSIQQIFF